MQLIIAILWLLTVHGSPTTITNDETTTNSYDLLETREIDTSDNATTDRSYDIEEHKTIKARTLENDTNVNYVKIMPEEKLAEVNYSTYAPIDILTTIPSIILESLNPNKAAEMQSNFDELNSDMKANITLIEDVKSHVNQIDNDLEATTSGVFLDDIKSNASNLFHGDAIYDNVISDRIGIAADYTDDFQVQDKSKTSSWKPVWPYSSIPTFQSTPLPEDDPRTVINNAFTTVSSFNDISKVFSKEPVTAYYFDVSNTPLPAVGPLHDPTDLYEAGDFNFPVNTRINPYSQSITEFINNQTAPPSHKLKPIIETVPIISVVPTQYSNKLAQNEYSILNHNLNHDREEYSVTFSTILPSMKEVTPTMAVKKLIPIKVNTEKWESSSDFKSEKEQVTSTTKYAAIDLNFNLESSMKHKNFSPIMTETPVFIPTFPMTESQFIKNDTTVLTLPDITTEIVYGILPKSDIKEYSPADIILEGQLLNVSTTKKTILNYPTIEGFDDKFGVPDSNKRTSEISTELSITAESSRTTTGPFEYDHQDYKTHQQKSESPTFTTKSPLEKQAQDEYKDSGAQSPYNRTTLSPTTEIFIPTTNKKTTLSSNFEYHAPGEIVISATEFSLTTQIESSTDTVPHILKEDNMIKTVIKHFPGKEEPELKIIQMHSNGTTVTKPSPYLKAALSYGVQEFCRHQSNIRSLLGEWVNEHLKNETESSSYEVQFFAKPNCSNVSPLSEQNDEKTKTVLYFYVMDDGLINPNITMRYPKNPTNLEISQKLAYLKEKILHLELVNAITSSEDLVLEEAAVGTSIIAITISTIIFIFLVISAGLAFIIIKRRRSKDQLHGRRCTPAANDTYSMDSVSVFYHSFKRKSKKRCSNKSLRSYQNQGFEDPNGPSRQLNFGKLTHFISDIEGIYDEFLKIPSVTPKYDEMPKGVEDKNRYANVIPVPETRVFLKSNSGNPSEEYINANYIHGARGEAKFYIAAQAPLDETVPDFWRMVWEQETKVIVMLTDFVEKGIDKCADYLPPSETLDCHRVYGDFQVTLKSIDMREKYVVSQVQLKNLENNLVREIAHMWYTGWPYSGIPNEEKTFISYIFETRAMRKKLRAKGPIVVHCSPGTGRSGTFIGCDISMRNFDDQKSVDIPKAVWKIRRERAGAVQTKEQYGFIYRVTNLYAAKLMTGNLDLF